MSLLAMVPMAKKRSEVMTRISQEALDQAKLACAFEGLTMAEFISRAVIEVADRAIDRGIAKRNQAKPPKSK